jgi:hypothetical protein
MLSSLRNHVAAAAALGTILVATAANAQDKAGGFGEQGQFIFGADRLFSLFSYTSNQYTNTQVNPNQSVTITGTSMSLLWGTNALSGAANAPGLPAGGNPNIYAPPRLGFDYTIIPHLTIGGELIVFFTLGGSTTTSQGNNSVSVGSPGANTFGVAPRAGYIIGINDLLSIWLRAGFSYYNMNTSLSDAGCTGGSSGNDTNNLNVFGIDLDPQLVISPVNHFAFTAGPALDWGFAGGASSTTPNKPQCNSTTTTSYNYNAINFSINGGMIGWF